MRIFSTLRYTVILLAVFCVSCGTALPTIKPYKLDVQQGNVVTSKMLLQLRPGMTKSQVRFVMGTPLIQDSFHGNRWDYVYQMREKGKIIEQRRVILDFEGDSLKTVRGDVIPKGSEPKSDEGVASGGTRVINPTDKPAEKGMLDKLKFWKKDDAALAKEAEAAKAKLEAEEAARNADEQAKEDLARRSASPLEEPQSMMAVPLEAMPIGVESPAAAPTNTPAETGVLPSAKPTNDASPVAQPPAVKEQRTRVEKNPESKKADQAPVVAPTKTQAIEDESVKAVPEPVESYKPASGMGFDKNLKAPEEAEMKPVPKAAMPRAGNKSIPEAKELPAEDEPSFFDRLLEKIGF
jgi:outer membrane protein assembly factor BamE